MVVLIIVLKTIVAVLSVLLSLLILLHKGKGGGLSDMFGGGLTANAHPGSRRRTSTVGRSASRSYGFC